jgi:hypothetical protein
VSDPKLGAFKIPSLIPYPGAAELDEGSVVSHDSQAANSLTHEQTRVRDLSTDTQPRSRSNGELTGRNDPIDVSVNERLDGPRRMSGSKTCPAPKGFAGFAEMMKTLD